MAEAIEFEVLDGSSNAVVARHPDRQYPGVLLQGDTLRILLEDVVELNEAARRGDCVAGLDVTEGLAEQLTDLLKHYEKVLEAHGIPLPYLNPVGGGET